jgi:ectoine hydroxylase-related dioxygenase (phytanoyl-CoA dioxygenase family)
MNATETNTSDINMNDIDIEHDRIEHDRIQHNSSNIIDLDSAYALSEEHIAQFRRDGFIKLKDVLSAETLGHYGREITRLTIDLNTERRPLEERSTYDRAFLQVMNLWEQSPLVGRFVMGQRLARIAAELLQVRGVRLYHDQSLYKEPGGGITPAHADQYYWPLDSDRTVTAWVPLQAVPPDMGPLGFYARSQSVAFGRDLGISDESEEKISANMAAHDFAFESGGFDLGEVSFHLGWTFHKAGANLSDRPRSVMTIIYMDADMRLTEALNPIQANDRDQWCPGAQPGQTIDTRKNPVIWSRA